MHSATPIPPAPPAVLRFSSALLYGTGALLLLSTVLDLVFVNTDLSVHKDAYTGSTGSGFASLVAATFRISVAGVLAALAVMNNHGSARSRVATFVVGGLFLVCGGFVAQFNGFHGVDRPVQDAAVALVYGFTAAALELLVLLGVLGGIVLLALPPATRFFEARRPVGYIPVYAAPPPPASPPPHGSPPPPGSPVPFVSPPPHTGSIPMADPWAESEQQTDLR